MTQDFSRRIWIDLVLLALLWGASFLAIRVSLDEFGPLWVVAGRTSLAALALWSVILLAGWSRPPLRLWWAFLGMGVLNNVIPFGLIAWGQLHVETGLAAIFNASTAVWGVLVAAMLLPDERLTLRRAIGVAVGFAGVAVAIGLDSLATLDLRSLGQFAIIGAAVSYAFSGVWARVFVRGIPPIAAAAAMLTCSALISIPLALWVEGPVSLALEARTWVAMAYLGLGATAMAYLLYYRLIATAGTGNALLVTLLVAPVAIVIGAVVRGEQLGAEAYLGLVLLALGLMILDGRALRALAKRRARG